MKNLIISKLRTRTTEQLKNDVITAMNSTDEGSIVVFSCGLDILEERLCEEEYKQFEESL